MQMTENIFSNTHPEAGLATNGHSKFCAKRGGKRCVEEPRLELRQTRSGSGSSVGAAWDPIKYKKMARHGKTNQNIRS